jgi:tRNA1(Val) A37 N6-methylase TrmN6
MEKYETPQKQFWTGNFGDEYINRNKAEELLASNSAMFSRIFSRTANINYIIEFGSNIGLYLVPINKLLPKVEISAVEINKKAVEQLRLISNIKVYNMSILNFRCDY